MIRFLRKGGGEELHGVLSLIVFFFSRPTVHFSFASVGILRETVQGPTRVDVNSN